MHFANFLEKTIPLECSSREHPVCGFGGSRINVVLRYTDVNTQINSF